MGVLTVSSRLPCFTNPTIRLSVQRSRMPLAALHTVDVTHILVIFRLQTLSSHLTLPFWYQLPLLELQLTYSILALLQYILYIASACCFDKCASNVRVE